MMLNVSQYHLLVRIAQGSLLKKNNNKSFQVPPLLRNQILANALGDSCDQASLGDAKVSGSVKPNTQELTFNCQLLDIFKK